MSHITVNASIGKPLVTIGKNSRGKLAISRHWHTVNNPAPFARDESVWSSSALLPNLHRHELLNLKANLAQLAHTPLSWSPPKCITPASTSVALINYNQHTGTHAIAHIVSTKGNRDKNKLLQLPAEYFHFATNPGNLIDADQARAIFFAIQYTVTPEELDQFVSLWPGIDILNQETQLSNYHLRPNPSKQTPLENFPSTVEEALALNIQLLEPKPEPVENPNNSQPTEDREPHLEFHTAPTDAAPFLIPNLSPTNHSLPRAKPATPAPYYLWARTIAAGKQNRRREVFYAKPQTGNVEAFPICPLKSTVALLARDTNPLSPTYAQAVIKSICATTSTAEEITNFLASYGEHMTEEQTSALLNPFSYPNQPQSFKKEQNQMPNNPIPCNQCGTAFVPERSSARFCSVGCRTEFYSQSRRKQQPHAEGQPKPAPNLLAQPDNLVTQEQFQALSAQVAQLVQLLTPKG